jgi:zinc finger CCCH domain-containing protein 13
MFILHKYKSQVRRRGERREKVRGEIEIEIEIER